MTQCNNKVCKNCTCGRAAYLSVDRVHANANFKPAARPKRVVRRDPVEAAMRMTVRFEESLKILA
jgi:hypothetical protein